MESALALHSLLSLEVPVQKPGRGFEQLQPAGITQESVDFIRENQLFKRHTLLTECFCKSNTLRERNVAVIIAVDQKRTGERHPFTCAKGEDSKASVAACWRAMGS